MRKHNGKRIKCLLQHFSPQFSKGIGLCGHYNSGLCTEGLNYPFPKREILDSSKLNEFADDNFKFDENG